MKRQQIAQVRAFNRFYTGIIGLLDQHILSSDYSLPEVRVLYEIYHADEITASDIIVTLQIDKGYLSRILRSFQAAKLVSKKWSAHDGRAAYLALTEKGRKEFETLNEASDQQIKNILGRLTEQDRHKLVGHMLDIKSILSKTNRSENYE
jgi:DNA-binding MarR family transcriptional regulator